MFSATVRKYLSEKRLQAGNQRGYSLIELVASLVLLAAIAALSLPTYQDFSPHADAAGQAVHPQSAGDARTAGKTSGEEIRPGQPGQEQSEQRANGTMTEGESGEATGKQSREA